MDDSMIGRWLSELPMDDPTRKSTSKPMLRRFVHYNEPVCYRDLLGEGTDGMVCRAEIAGNEYALKIFKNWTYQDKLPLTEKEQPYTFPFSHECRAFARLDSVGENGTWAVKCHGWMKLSDEQFRPLRRTWGGVCSRWTIVKDYIADPLRITDVPEIQRKMRIARKALLHPRDVRPQNFCRSYFVDLGSVFTYPYVRRIWSDQRRRQFFERFDEYSSAWQVSIRDGTVVEGWLNEMFKKHRADNEERARDQREEDLELPGFVATAEEYLAIER